MSAVFLRLLTHGVAPGLAMLALSACSPGGLVDSTGFSTAVGPSGLIAGPSGPPASLDTQEACRARVNEMYERRDRADLYAPGSTVNTPFSSNYQSGVTSRGLANQYAYEKTKYDCERGAGTASSQTAAPAPMSVPPGPNRR